MPGHFGGSHAELLSWPLEEMQSGLPHSGGMSAKGKDSSIDIKFLFLHSLQLRNKIFGLLAWMKVNHESATCKRLRALGFQGRLYVGLGIPLELHCFTGSCTCWKCRRAE